MVWDLENSRKGYRDSLEIIRDILQIAAESGSSGSKKTHIMYGANLSYKLLIRYLDKVSTAGLILEENSCYVITDKGKEFLRIYSEYEIESKEIEKHNERLNNGKGELMKLASIEE